MIDVKEIEELNEFLALAYLLEEESADRYHELADNMEVHNNPEAAALFRKLAEFGELHAAEVVELAGGALAAEVAESSLQWEMPEGPETTPYDALHYQITVPEALDLALHNEIRGRDFYAEVARLSPSQHVRDTAKAFAAEESEHVALIREQIAECGEPGEREEDWDPPNMPE